MARRRSSQSSDKITAAITKAIGSLVGAVFTALVRVISKWLGKAASIRHESIDLPHSGDFSYEIVGESHYQHVLESICGGRTEDGADMLVEAKLVLEDSNQYDNQAVRVDIEGKTVGYLSKSNARQYRKYLHQAGHGKVIGRCAAEIVGGWDRGGDDRGSFGVKLDLSVK